MDNDKTYYFEYIGGYMIEGNKVVLRSLCDDKIITRVVHDEKENGLYIVYKGIKYYDMYHIKY